MSKTVARKDNLSGHVCFDVPQTRFFQEVYAKVHNLETRRRHGMLEEKRGRNPLNAEQTPRDNEPFEYCPPPAKPQEERWKYPDSDWGLMAKFRSQKQIYDDIFNKEKEYQKRVDTVAAIREENQKMIRDEFQRQKEQYDEAKKQREALDKSRFQAIMGVNSKGSNLLSHEDNGLDELDLAMRSDAAAARAAEKERARKRRGNSNIMVLKPEATPPKDFYHTKISTFKVIGEEHKHPEVLAEWRAKRAADFVSKQSNALEPPPHRPAPDQSFRPGGILPAKTNTFIRTDVVKPNTSRNNKKTMSSSGSTNALGSINLQNLNLNVLNEELKRTEEAMQRQQLKIKLNTKQPKRFEVAKNEGRKSTKNDVDSPY